MIVLDTNVVSEITRRVPESAVLEWLDARFAADLAITTVTVAELRYGVARLAPGRRKTGLATEIHHVIDIDFAGRIQPFDITAAEAYASVVCGREQRGRPIAVPDAQIAAICLARGTTLATRNIADFQETGIGLMNPWHGR